MERDLMDLMTGTAPGLAVGDKAVLTGRGSEKFPGIWTVTKVNDVTYKLAKDGLSLKAHKILVQRAGAAEIAAEESKPAPRHYLPGQIVKVSAYRARPGRMDASAYYVVISHDMAKGRAKVVRLGGEGGGVTWTCSDRLLIPQTAPGKWLLETHCTPLVSDKAPQVTRTRLHRGWGHGLEPGTTESLSCGTCLREKQDGTPPIITTS